MKIKEVEMIEEMTEEQLVIEERMMIEKWVKKNKPKRYTHGERPEGTEEGLIVKEEQAAKDAEKE